LSKKKLRVIFGNPHRLPETRDAIEYKFPFSIVDASLVGKPEEKSETKHYIIKTSITGTLAACWGWGYSKPNTDLLKVLFEYSKRNITKKLKDGTLKEKEELWLSTESYPNKCPFDSSRIPDPSQWSFNVQIP